MVVTGVAMCSGHSFFIMIEYIEFLISLFTLLLLISIKQ